MQFTNLMRQKIRIICQEHPEHLQAVPTAVCTGDVPFALASQTAGSIIRPASFCGVWGMKPSFGLIARTGVLKTNDTLDTIGFMTSNIYNLNIILENIRLKGPNYPLIYKNIDKKNCPKKIFDWFFRNRSM